MSRCLLTSLLVCFAACSGEFAMRDQPDAGDAQRDGGAQSDAGRGGVIDAGADVPAELRAVVDMHNVARVQVGSPPLAWNAGVAQTALEWAELCSFSHEPNADRTYMGQPLGENLAWGAGSFAADQLARLWINEQQNYDCDSNTCAPGQACGHYTQVIWRTTTELGCALAICNSSTQYLVCRYLPPGNIIGFRPVPAQDCP